MKEYIDKEWFYNELETLRAELNEFKNSKATLMQCYPIGSIYTSTITTNPETLLGFGTWEQIKDRFLLASGSSYSSGATGGEASHKLTVNEMPGHDHTQYGVTSGPANSSPIRFSIQNDGNVVIYNNENTALWSTKTSGVATTKTFRQTDINKDGTTSSTGGNSSHNNMPPYLVVNIWRRVA